MSYFRIEKNKLKQPFKSELRNEKSGISSDPQIYVVRLNEQKLDCRFQEVGLKPDQLEKPQR